MTETERHDWWNAELAADLTPTQITNSYIVDYRKWCEAAWALSEEALAAGKRVDKHEWIGPVYYWGIIVRYTYEGRDYQGLAYGNIPAHHPDQESVQSESIDGESAVVETLYQHPQMDFIQNRFEYHFERREDQWRLLEVYLVDDEGKYPGL